MKLGLPILIVLIIATACVRESKETLGRKEVLEHQIEGAGIFGVVIGMDSAQIAPPTFSNLFNKSGEEYRFQGSWSESIGLTMYLTLDKGKVYEITLDMECPTESANDSLFEVLLGQLDGIYGASHPAPGYATWSTSSDAGRLVEVSLVDESFELERPRIMMNWLEHYDRKYSH